MKKTRAVVVAVGLVAACSPSDIEASDYDQSCAKDDDCVAVAELHSHGTDCSMGCDEHAINKKDKTLYDEDLARSRGRCTMMAAPFCDDTGVPKCVESRCTMVPSH